MWKSYSLKKLASYSLVASLAGIVVGQAQRVQAITLNFDYTYDDNNFFDENTLEGAARRVTLDEAASYFEPLTDNLDAITDDPNDNTDIGPTGKFTSGGTEIINSWTANFSHPSQNFTQSLPDPTIEADTLKIYVGARNLSSLGQGGPGGFGVSGLSDFVSKVKARGQTSPLETTPTEFGPWGGSISFDNNLTSGWSWNDDFNDPLEEYEYDFLSVAIHEIAHVMGIGTAPSWNTYVSGTDFIGDDSVLAYQQDFPLATSVPLTSDGGHWAEGTQSYVNGVSQEAAMDPTINSVNNLGQRKVFTDLDYAGLADVGWQTEAVSAAVPFEFSPGLGIVLVSGVFGAKKGLQEFKKRKNQSSII